MCNYGKKINQTISLYFDLWNWFFFFLPLQMSMLAKRTKCNKASVMNACSS